MTIKLRFLFLCLLVNSYVFAQCDVSFITQNCLYSDSTIYFINTSEDVSDSSLIFQWSIQGSDSPIYSTHTEYSFTEPGLYNVSLALINNGCFT